MKLKISYLTIFILLLVIMGGVLLSNPWGVLKAENGTKDRIAYVDVWEVFNSHPQKAAAEEELNQLAQSMQAELEEKAKDLSTEEQQSLLEEYQSKLSQQEEELIQGILNAIEEVIVTVAQEKEVRLVLDKKNVIYGGYDLTPDVIKYIQENFSEEDTTGLEENSTENVEPQE